MNEILNKPRSAMTHPSPQIPPLTASCIIGPLEASHSLPFHRIPNVARSDVPRRGVPPSPSDRRKVLHRTIPTAVPYSIGELDLPHPRYRTAALPSVYVHDDSHVPCQPDARMTKPQQERCSHLTKREPSTSDGEGRTHYRPHNSHVGCRPFSRPRCRGNGKRGRARHEEPWSPAEHSWQPRADSSREMG